MATSEDDEEMEPMLKYSRLGNDLKKMLKNDQASCLAVHEKFLALGTQEGAVQIFDHEGNLVPDKRLASHEITVNQISIDTNGEHLASCSDDGKAVIHGLYRNEHEKQLIFDRPVKAVAIDPNFSRRGGAKKLVTGDDKLILSEESKSLFGKNYSNHTLHHGEGIITDIRWKGNLIAWANDIGVKIYDVQSKQRISSILFEFPDNFRNRRDLYRCNLCWKNENTLLIGWGNKVKICDVGIDAERDKKGLPAKFVKISAQFDTDYYIAGIAPFDDTSIVLLTYSESEVIVEGNKAINPRPHVRLVEPKMGCSDERSNDALGTREYEKYRCDLYRLEWVPAEMIYFVVSPADVIIAKPRTADDHVIWLIEHKQFEEAIRTVQKEGQNIKAFTFKSIGNMQLDHLLAEQKYEEAARKCVRVLENDQDGWETMFYKFRDVKHATLLANYLPQENPRLNPSVYELTLYEFLNSDISGFLALLKSWDKTLYDHKVIINAVLTLIKQEQLGQEELHKLYECLAVLYTNQRNYSEALSVYLRLKHKDVFSFIHKHDLFSSIDNKIILLMDFDTTKAIQLLMDNTQMIPPQKVVDQLNSNLRYQFLYLDKLSQKSPEDCRKYHSKMVFLYAEYARDKLLSFLKRCDGYDQNVAMKLCDERQLLPEKVFLLGKMGQHRQALELIILELKDVKYAIDFCKEHNDRPLWDQLISYSIDKPSFVKGLLDSIGTHVDPLVLIEKIKENMKIPGLRDSLVKILHDYNLQISLRKGCQKILTTDVYNLLRQSVTLQKKGYCVRDEQVCVMCKERIIPKDLQYASDVHFFYCQHAFHEDCLLTSHYPSSCTVCNAPKKGFNA